MAHILCTPDEITIPEDEWKDRINLMLAPHGPGVWKLRGSSVCWRAKLNRKLETKERAFIANQMEFWAKQQIFFGLGEFLAALTPVEVDVIWARQWVKVTRSGLYLVERDGEHGTHSLGGYKQ